MYFDCHVINKGLEVDHFMVTVAYKIYGDQTYSAKHRIVDRKKYIALYTMQGRGCIEIDGVTHHVEAGQLIVINANKSISYRTDKDKWHIWLFEYKVQEHCLEVNKVLNVALSAAELQFCQLCLWALKKGNYKQASAYLACIYYICLDKSVIETCSEGKFLDAIGYMKEHRYDCTVAEVAEEVGVSESGLRKIFQDNSNLLPKKYLDMLKIEEAKILLETSEILVKDISLKLGFCNPYHFCETFKKHIGMSPRHYRKEYHCK